MSDATSRYRFRDAPLARGSQGTVWMAEDEAGRRVAVKIAGANSESQVAIRREIRVMRALNEAEVEGVVEVLDDLEVDGRPAMVMPYFERHLGHWLEEIVESPGPRTLEEILRMCALVAFVLADVHRTWIEDGTVVHRDVKPENIFLDDHGDPHLGDFGGAMAIDGLRAVELALFGTPMWAPLDQILPGNTIPDPTWDTYALCVLLYAALTGERPQYQSDPTSLLTEQGRELWNAARGAIRAPKDERRKWHAHFARARIGTRPEDLVDLTGKGALSAEDRATLEAGIHRLAALARLDARREASLTRRVWALLVRGLSPVSHPSPPNRYREAEELGEALQRLRVEVSGAQDRGALLSQLVAPDGLIPEETTEELRRPPRTTLTAGVPVLFLLLLAVGLVTIGGAAWVFREPLMALAGAFTPLPATVAAGDVRIDTTEATVHRWNACVAAGACVGEARPGIPDLPVVGLSIDDAAALCAFGGGRLPAHAEWAAAAGPGPYPWGAEAPTCKRAWAHGCGDGVQPVGLTRQGAAPSGAVDMAGNAWEWVDGPDGPVLVGGGAHSTATELRTDAVRPAPVDARHPLAGVRCVHVDGAP